MYSLYARYMRWAEVISGTLTTTRKVDLSGSICSSLLYEKSHCIYPTCPTSITFAPRSKYLLLLGLHTAAQIALGDGCLVLADCHDCTLPSCSPAEGRDHNYACRVTVARRPLQWPPAAAITAASSIEMPWAVAA